MRKAEEILKEMDAEWILFLQSNGAERVQAYNRFVELGDEWREAFYAEKGK